MARHIIQSILLVYGGLNTDGRCVPTHPVLHAQVKLPTVLTHEAAVWHVSVSRMHSLISPHATPLPENPVLQPQVNDPVVSVHVALAWQESISRAHSSRLAHAVPDPVYPLLHAQLKLPAEFVHKD